MSEEKIPIKLKVDPQELHKNRPSKVQVSEEPAMVDDSATIGLKKHEIPVAIKTVQPAAGDAAQNDNAKSVEAQLDDIRRQAKKQTKERRKRVKTKAEAAYRKSVLLSIVVLLLLLIISALVATGATSFYLITRVIAKPANGYVLRKAVFEIRNTPGLSAKWQIFSRTLDEVRDKSNDDVEEPEKKSGSKRMRAIRERSEAAEDAANNGVR